MQCLHGSFVLWHCAVTHSDCSSAQLCHSLLLLLQLLALRRCLTLLPLLLLLLPLLRTHCRPDKSSGENLSDVEKTLNKRRADLADAQAMWLRTQAADDMNCEAIHQAFLRYYSSTVTCPRVQ
jgi:hypothetical protein